MNWSAAEGMPGPSSLARVTLTIPMVWAGDTAEICVSLSTVKLAAGVVPKDTPVTEANLIPVMITGVSPTMIPMPEKCSESSGL